MFFSKCYSAVDGPSESLGSKDNLASIDFRWGVKIPMRDDVELNATVYIPKEQKPKPAIFTLTPYISDSYHERAYYFARKGLPFLLVDCRGRGNSGGEFEPFVNEAEDGHDIVLWLAEQAWCSGEVTMWGGSYAGFNQWMTLKEFPGPLKTIVPAASAHAAVDFPFYKNIFFPYEMQWQTFTSGNTPNKNLFDEPDFWISKFQELYLSHRPFKELDKIVGNESTHFQTWIQHPTPDTYWASMALTPEEYERIDIPILTITGHYDGDQPGAMHFYREHMKFGSPRAKNNHFLVIGPWDHAGTRTPSKKVGGLEFGDGSMVDLNKLHTEWYEWRMGDGSKPEFLRNRVAYYVLGAEEWRYVDDLDGVASTRQRLYLDSVGGSANDVFQSGMLVDEIRVSSEPDNYVYDPLEVRPAEFLQEEVANYLTDQRYVLNLFGNGLVYHSAPFDDEVEISGNLKLVVWMAIDVPDTDFGAAVYEITLEGRSILLTEDLLRARYRESLLDEKLVEPGKINRYVFDGFTFFSKLIGKGSRLQLLLKSPNTIYIQKNYNGGGVVAEESGEDARTAHVTVYHDEKYPSYLEAPVNPKEEG